MDDTPTSKELVFMKIGPMERFEKEWLSKLAEDADTDTAMFACFIIREFLDKNTMPPEIQEMLQ